MKLPSLAAAALILLATLAPASAATLLSSYTRLILSGGGVDYLVDTGTGDAFATGEVSDGLTSYSFDFTGFVNPADPMDMPVGSLLVSELPLFDPVFLDGLLEQIEIGADYAALLFGDLKGDGAKTFGKTALVVFTGFDGNDPEGTATVRILAPIPLPAGAALLLTGMVALVLVSRRRRAGQSLTV